MNGTVNVTIDGTPYSVSISANGITIPYVSGKDYNTLSIDGDDEDYKNFLSSAGSKNLTLSGTGTITVADMDTVANIIKSKISTTWAAGVGLSGLSIETPSNSDLGAPTQATGSFDGQSVTFDRYTTDNEGNLLSNPVVKVEIPWDGTYNSGFTGQHGIINGDDVFVTWKKSGSDRVRFGDIANARASLVSLAGITDKSKIHMNSADGSDAVQPVFNGDDMFYTGTSESDATYNPTPVFTQYNNGDRIFGNFIFRADANGKYIDNVSGSTVFVERLKFRRNNMNYLYGFGLRSISGAVLTNSTIIAGTVKQGMSHIGDAFISVDDIKTGFANLGITAANVMPWQVEGLKLRSVHSGSTTKNLADPNNTIILKWLEQYFVGTDNRSRLTGLDILTTNGGMIVQKSNPYSGNSYSSADSVNGNLAVFLGSHSVALREVYLTDPTLYTSTTSIGSLRNVVLAGNNWKNIEVDAASSGVIVSVNTPVKELNAGNSNLWYVVQHYNDTSHDSIIANIQVLEVHNQNAAARLAGPSPSFSILGLITPNGIIEPILASKFPPTNSYDNGSRPVKSWQDWAAATISGTPSLSLAPVQSGVYLAAAEQASRPAWDMGVPYDQLDDAAKDGVYAVLASVYDKEANGAITSGDVVLANRLMDYVNGSRGFSERNKKLILGFFFRVFRVFRG